MTNKTPFAPEILQRDAELLRAAGFDGGNLEPFQAFQIAGAIERDPVIFKLTLALPRDREFPAVIPMGATLQVLKKMSNVQRVELRERIQARCPHLFQEVNRG